VPRGSTYKYQSGEAWLREQPEETQRRMFPSRASHQAWKDGRLPLRAFVGRKDHRIWGQSIYQRSGRQALDSAGLPARYGSGNGGSAASGPGPTPQPQPPAPSAPNPDTDTPVSAAFRIPSGGASGVVNEALTAIDSVHTDGQLPTIPVSWTRARTVAGQYEFDQLGGAHGMNISTVKSLPQRNTVAHETGHFLDHQVLGQRGKFATLQPPGTPEFAALQPWRTAVRTSRRGKTMTSALKTGELEYNGPNGREFGSVAPKAILYLNDEREMWARSYSQWIAIRSGNSGMLRDLESMRNDPGAVLVQWDDNDFDDIARAFDDLFGGKGWRK
jgi:hypothetical protein